MPNYGKDSLPIHTLEEGKILLKPMNVLTTAEYINSNPVIQNCHVLAEFGTVYRYEQSGECTD